jgi:hypothetical protein
MMAVDFSAESAVRRNGRPKGRVILSARLRGRGRPAGLIRNRRNSPVRAGAGVVHPLATLSRGTLSKPLPRSSVYRLRRHWNDGNHAWCPG